MELLSTEITALGIEHMSDFGDDIVVYMMLELYNEELVQAAKGHEEEENWFEPNCFGVCFNYDKKTKKSEIVTEYEKELYYVDFYGVKHYLNVSISDEVKERMMRAIEEEIDGKQ